MKVYKRTQLFLQLLQLSTPSDRRLLLRATPDGFLRLLTEVVFNVLCGNLSISTRHLQSLRRYKQTLRQLSQRSLALDHKRSLLQQHASSSLIPHLLSLVSLAI